jgi:energy-coupling factor transporter ATP-binding protein EcfA2
MMSFSQAGTPEGKAEFNGMVRDAFRPKATARVAVRPEQVITPGPDAVTPPPARALPDAPALLGQVLEQMAIYLTEYAQFPSKSAAVATTLWIAHAAARDSERNLIWRASPRLLLTSAQNGSGKSTVLDMIAILLQSRAGRMVKVTPYGLAKVLGAYKEVGLPDDAQQIFGTNGTAAKELLGILLGSYTRGGTWVSGKANGKIESVYGPVAIAGKDSLITTNAAALDDLLKRSIIIRMERPAVFMPQLDEDGEEWGAAIGKALEAVVGALQGQFKQAALDLAREARGQVITDGDGGRTGQIWRQLEAVARVAGGPWVPAVAQAADELAAACGDLLGAEEALADMAGMRSAGRKFWDE